jgi:DNA-binding NarL/FixJ family response regulator
MSEIKVLIVDDHLLVRSGIISLIADQSDIVAAGEAGSGEEALNMIEFCDPDVILMDISMAGMSGLQAAEIIKVKYPEIKILILTMHEEKEYIYNALKTKVEGILNKNASKTEIVEAIRSVAAGGKYYGKTVSEILANHFVENITQAETRSKLFLTKREKEILSYIAEGLSTSDIAEHLAISTRTVESHRSNLIQKYDLKNVQGLFKFAIDFKASQNK